jgi:hypothetical protein
MPAKAGIRSSEAARVIANAGDYWIVRLSLSSGRPSAGPG